MRNIYIFISMLLVATSAANADTPEIRWLETDHDFGAFDESVGLAECTFKYVNTGTAPLVVISARANCGCTTPRYDKMPLMPGDTAAISVAYDAGGRPGRFEKKVYIVTNTVPDKSTLTIRGTVIGSPTTLRGKYPVEAGPLLLSQPALVMGEVTKGKIKNLFVDGYNATSDTIYPQVSGEPGYLQVSVTPRAVAPGEQVSLSFFLRSDRCQEYGVVTDTLTLTPDAAHPELAVPFATVFIAQEDFSRLTPGQRAKAPVATLATDRIDLGLNAEVPSTTTVNLRNNGGSTLHIRRIYTADPGVTASVKNREVKKGKDTSLNINIGPEAVGPDGIINAKLQIITDDPGAPVQNIRIVGIVAKQ